MAAVEVRAAAREIASKSRHRRTADRDDALLAALADHAHEPSVQIDAGLVQPHGLRDTQSGAIEQLDERLVT